MVRLTVAGPPDGQPPQIIEVDDPLSTPAELIVTNDHVQSAIKQAGITKSEAREQAAIIQAQREEITTLRAALAETQDVMFKGKTAYNDVVSKKDLQVATLYELAASGVRERAKLRQELSEIQAEMQGTKRQLHAFMASLMQLKSSMDSAGDGDTEHALELLQSSSWTQSMQAVTGAPPQLAADEDVYMQLVQMQQLSDTLVQDMRQDEELMQQGMEPLSRPSSIDDSMDSLDSMDSIDLPPAPSTLKSSSSSISSSREAAAVPREPAPAPPQPPPPVSPASIPPSKASISWSKNGNSAGGGWGKKPGSNGNGTSSSSSNGFYTWR